MPGLKLYNPSARVLGYGKSVGIIGPEQPSRSTLLPMGIRSKLPYTRHLKTGARASVRECNEHWYGASVRNSINSNTFRQATLSVFDP